MILVTTQEIKPSWGFIFDQFLDNNGRTLNLISGPTYTGANLGSAEG